VGSAGGRHEGRMRRFVTFAVAIAMPLIVLAACARLVLDQRPSQAVPPQNARLAGVIPGPAVASLGLSADETQRALASFIESCPKLVRRGDSSGLARPADWRAACAAASGHSGAHATGFFATHFETVRIGEGDAFATGYFEPEIAGSRTKRPGFDVPVYAMPSDLVRAWPGDVPPEERTGRPPLGRYDENGGFVLYHDRAAIEDGAIDGRAPVIAWAADPVEFFFLQIQGSGRLVTPEGEVIRIGYAGQNGRGYTAIGGVLRERGLLGDGPGQYPASMQGIMVYIREHPEKGRELMRLNKSWIFFRELTGDGPLGSLGVPVRGEVSVAVDPAFVPLGAPVWLDLDRDEVDGLWIAQDTGGAIKGANRFDTFWGAGNRARDIAGGMSARGTALVLLPRGAYDRIAAER